jgi:hypothetical protein
MNATKIVWGSSSGRQSSAGIGGRARPSPGGSEGAAEMTAMETPSRSVARTGDSLHRALASRASRGWALGYRPVLIQARSSLVSLAAYRGRRHRLGGYPCRRKSHERGQIRGQIGGPVDTTENDSNGSTEPDEHSAETTDLAGSVRPGVSEE